MTDEFPKNRRGWSGQGRTDARSLVGDEPDALTWLRKRRPGIEARDKGGHLVVTVDEQTGGIFQSLGVEETETCVRGSATARGTFAQSRVVPMSDLFFDQLIPRGDGTSYSIGTASYEGDGASVFSDELEQYTIGSYIVRLGQSALDRPPVVFRGVYDGDANSRLANVYPTIGARVDGVYEHAMAYSAVDPEGQHVIAVTFDNGADQRKVIAARVEDQMIFPVGFNRVGPTSFLGLAGSFLWRGGDLPWYDQTEAPGLFFFASLDNGESWFTFDATEFLEYEQEIYDDVANEGDTNILIYNQSMNSTAAYIVPLSRTKALVYAVLGCPDFVNDDPSGYRYERFRVRVGIADLEQGTVSLLATLYEPEFTTTNLLTNRRNATWRWERGACIAPGGGALVFFNDAVHPDNWTSKPQIHYTADGSALTLLGGMSIDAGRAGTPTALNANTLFMPVYDGTEHALFESTDRGLTWRRRATISTLAAESLPGPIDARTGPKSFNNVVWLRGNDRAKSATPSAPWLTDDRVTQPS